MKGKYVRINFCNDCPYRRYQDNDLYCGLNNKLLIEDEPIYSECEIPYWCPLPEVMEIKEDENQISIFLVIDK